MLKQFDQYYELDMLTYSTKVALRVAWGPSKPVTTNIVVFTCWHLWTGHINIPMVPILPHGR